jgi:hypothetical protein
MKAFTKTGSLGDGTREDTKFGEAYREAAISGAAKEIAQITGISSLHLEFFALVVARANQPTMPM